MTRLRSLLLVVGVASVGGVSYFVAVPAPGTTRADLLDAGLADCPRRHLVCDAYVSPDGRNHLADAGVSVARRYVPLRVRTRACDMPGANVALVLPVVGEERAGLRDVEILTDSCDVVVQDGTDFPAFEPATLPRCVRAQPDAGPLCRRLELDGGLRFTGWWNSIPRAEAVGPHCQPAPCTVLAGWATEED